MINKTVDFFMDIPMTLVGGVFLAASLALMLMGVTVAFDPAWATVLIALILKFSKFFSTCWLRKDNEEWGRIWLVVKAAPPALALGLVF